MMDVVRHELKLSGTSRRFPKKDTCLAIYSRCVNATRPLSDTLDKLYPWCSDWHAELARALSLGTTHMSLYQLTIEPSTRFATDVRQGVFEPLDDDNAADLFGLTRAMTAAAGLPAYEVSNHARPGRECAHNRAYWRPRDWIAMMKAAIKEAGRTFTTRRMVQDYVRKYYVPALRGDAAGDDPPIR